MSPVLTGISYISGLNAQTFIIPTTLGKLHIIYEFMENFLFSFIKIE